MKSTALAALMLMLAISPQVSRADANEPLRLGNGEPLVGVYYFTHWWEPWKSSDEANIRDLSRLREMGFNTIFLDHEWSQMIDGNWRLLDRGHKFAKDTGLQILPWLSLKTWSDIGNVQHRRNLIKEQYGVDLRVGTDSEGKSNDLVIPYDEATIIAGTEYVKEYLDRYANDSALLHLEWDGKLRPVVALSVELAWMGSCDETTQVMFRLWLEQKHKDIRLLNLGWNTRFNCFAEIDMCDETVFDLQGHAEGQAAHPMAVEDHVEFRSRVIDTSLAAIRERVRKHYPDVIIATELPYQFEAKHPHAIEYRIVYGANPSSAKHSDVLMIRATGLLDEAEQKAHLDFKKRTGIKTIMTYRAYAQWGERLLSGEYTPESMEAYAVQAANLAEGFGFYSFNEMVDTYLVPSPTPPLLPDKKLVSKEESEAALSAVDEMVDRYLEMVSPSE